MYGEAYVYRFDICPTYIKSVDFQVKSDMFTTEKRLPFTDEETVDAVHKREQHLHLEIRVLGYIPLLLNGLVYFRRIGDFREENLILRLFLAACSTEINGSGRNKFMGLTNTDGNIVLNLLMEWGIRTEEAECNLREL